MAEWSEAGWPSSAVRDDERYLDHIGCAETLTTESASLFTKGASMRIEACFLDALGKTSAEIITTALAIG